MRESLGAIGPVRRKRLESLFFEKEVMNFLRREKTILLIENDIWERDPFWGTIKKFVKFDYLTLMLRENKSLKDPIGYNHGKMYDKQSFSPKKFQTFLDCPRKFYYTYVDPFPSDFKISNTLTSAQLGELEHKVIEEFSIKKHDGHDKIPGIVKTGLDDFLLKNRIRLKESDYLLASNEITNWASNGIDFVQDLRKKFHIRDFHLEKKISNGIFEGRVIFLLHLKKVISLWILNDQKIQCLHSVKLRTLKIYKFSPISTI